MVKKRKKKRNEAIFAELMKDPKWVEEHYMLYVGFVDSKLVGESSFMNELLKKMGEEYPHKFHFIRQVKQWNARPPTQVGGLFLARLPQPSTDPGIAH